MSLETAFEVGQASAQIKRIADVLTASQKDVFVRLPGLSHYYPGGIRGATGDLIDHSGAGTGLTETGSCPTGYDGNAYVKIGGGTNFLSNSGVGQATGGESWIDSSIHGMTIGGWVEVDVQGGLSAGIVTREAASPQRGWALLWNVAGTASFQVSGNGAAIVSAISAPTSINTWHFIVGRFTPSTEVAVIVDGQKATNIVAVPALINVSTASFELGRYVQNNGRILDGKVRDLFICRAALSDEQIEQIRQTSVP
jgi:hypothetical protein